MGDESRPRRFDVFGRLIEVVREDGAWRAFLVGDDGKKSTRRAPTIPDFVGEDGIVRYLADLYHESASPERPDAIEVTPDEGERGA